MSTRSEVLSSLEVGTPNLSREESSRQSPDIAVVFTSVAATIAALRRASELAAGLNSRIALVFAQVVPYPLPLERPTVPLAFSAKLIQQIEAESSVKITTQLYLCRTDWQTLASVLKPRSVVVMGVRRRWWPTKKERLAKALRRSGFEVIVEKIDSSD